MKFLTPSAGFSSKDFGIITSFKHGTPPQGVKDGMLFGVDNCAFSGGFKTVKFFKYLDMLKPYKRNCLFVVVPDSVGDAKKTKDMFDLYRHQLSGWPLAFVAQDGQENLSFPDGFDCLFIGGSTEWKTSTAAEFCIKKAQELGKHIHIGRVNWWKRYAHFTLMKGSSKFTCDGTRQRFEGRDNTIKAWRGYMSQKPLIRI